MMSNWFLYLVTVAVWGTTWIAIEFQLGSVAPEVSVFYRYALASVILFVWCRVRHLQVRFDRNAHILFVMLGALLFCVNYILTYYAQQYITSALTAIAFSTMLWMNILNARIFFGTRAGVSVLAGSVLGVIGICFLFLPEIGRFSFSDATFFGASLAVLGAFIASLGNMVSQGAQAKGLPIVQSNAWGMLYGAILTGLVALFQERSFVIDSSATYLVSLLYLAVFGSIIGFGSYLTLLGRIGAHKAGYAMVMFPVVAVLVSVAFEGLELTLQMLTGVALVLLGNVLILRTRHQGNSEARHKSRDVRAFRYRFGRMR